MLQKGAKIVAALSGGVDSSVAAAIYKERGYDVIGVTLKLKSCDSSTEEKAKSCCGLDDDLQARSAAELIGIPHYFLDAKSEFKDLVLKRSWEEYSHARTPNPCVLCNRYLKFGKLMEYAEAIGAEGIITGHYAKINRTSSGICELMRGDDTLKDQTYFLFALTQAQLSKTYMPLGELNKREVRKYAGKIRLRNAEKQESQDACFGVPGECFAETLRKVFDGKATTGFFIAPDGTTLKQHEGIHRYTIGQRKGLGVALGTPAYVSKIDFESGNVFLATDQNKLMSNDFTVGCINWQQERFKSKTFNCMVQIRYNSKPVDAELSPLDADGANYRVVFETPQRAVTSGQAAVFYDQNQLIGGGWID